MLEELGQAADVDRDGGQGAVILLEPIGAEGYAELEAGERVSALNLGFPPNQAEPGRALVEALAARFGWEIIDDQESDEGD